MCLNRTAALVWQSCDGKSDISEITQKLEEELGASVNEELVLFAVSELNNKGLIENGEKIADSFRGLSRREIVRRVGFASLVTLPIVSSIVAPQAAAAQSRPGIRFTLIPDPTPTPTPTPCFRRERFITTSVCERRIGECAEAGYNNAWCRAHYRERARALCCSMNTIGLVLGGYPGTENFVCACA